MVMYLRLRKDIRFFNRLQMNRDKIRRTTDCLNAYLIFFKN